MPANIESRELLKKREIQESVNVDYPFIGLAGQNENENESEIKWVKLHQMFDR
tara:strand:+ start:76 stop:234 length:159 start_codon:yes stop_codon:yes gene_type:complete